VLLEQQLPTMQAQALLLIPPTGYDSCPCWVFALRPPHLAELQASSIK
jgi:hypothetical protein